ncbi:DUF4340 domain-containing protein [Plectonema cf. radiosum LEGE 06105]|uniref:DUF4340 domain-containing protein n=1 Tax=Plectonema cf. radiosum LEGE 06105 TaxID=945769 RepID=A0A8J7F2V0_9CYAN|nr:DUF4340 domain-containing protein [Plectonema radiosum]MBE9215143.1 DUF4340 domain-containing protein [Plectonema cf. radiosum LEGE 06105]
MKLQRTTLILILLAILLGGFVYFYEIQWKSQQEEVKKKQQQLFSFNEVDVKALKITTPSETITLERSPESSNTKWLMKSPDTVPANDGTVAYLLNLLVNENSDRAVTTSTSQLSEFGLTQPQAIIEITLNNGKTDKLVLGKPNFDDRFLYAQNNFATKPDGNVELVLVSKNFENAVKRSLSEWKAVNTRENIPSPSPEVTPTTLPTPVIPTIEPIPINPTPILTPTPTLTPTTTPTPANNQ